MYKGLILLLALGPGLNQVSLAQPGKSETPLEAKSPYYYPVAASLEKPLKPGTTSQKSGSHQIFFNCAKACPETAGNMQVHSSDGRLVLSGKEELLNYQFEYFPAPKGVDPAYGRSGFIHPLYAPGKLRLTQVQPADHYHHYGIWNPWTHLRYKGQEYDLWNLAKKQGTVRFKEFLHREQGPLFTGFTALHEHVIFPSSGKEEVIMLEEHNVRVYRPDNNYYLLDLNILLRTASNEKVNLLEYRYGGFGWRATEKWHKDNSEVLSSEGHDRSSVDNTHGRWFYYQGEIDRNYAGALVLSHPDNFNHPEPLRIWPLSHDSRGDVFASFSPTKDRDWIIEPGKEYQRRYRFIVYRGKMNAADAEQAWKDFAQYTLPLPEKEELRHE